MSALPALFLALTSTAAAEEPPSAAEMLDGMQLVQEITLISTGAEPLARVQYRPRPGATATYEMVTRMSMEMSVTMPDGQAMSIPAPAMPAVVVTSRNTVGQPVANGLVPVRVEHLGARTEGEVAPELAAAMKASLAQVEGLTFDMFVEPVGKPVQTDVVGGADPALRDALQSFADQVVDSIPAFPDEPIGVGAKWTTDLGMAISGLDLIVTQTNTVTAISPDAITIAYTMDMEMGRNGMALPGMPPGAKLDITKFEGAGSGTTRVDLGTLVPSGTMEMDVDTTMSMIPAPDQPALEMGMKMHQSIETRPAR